MKQKMKQKMNHLLANNNFFLKLYKLTKTILRRDVIHPNIFFDEMFSNVEDCSLVVNIHNIPGKFELDSRSDILKRILISKEYEPEFVELIKKSVVKNSDAINVGANIGLYTCLLADLIEPERKVLSIEPTPNAFNYLLSNIKRNNLENKIITYNGVASDSVGKFSINSIVGKEEYSSLGEMAHPSVIGQDVFSLEVDGETIDNLVAKHNIEPSIIVIDVEGAEYRVLLGAVNTIRKYRPIIISELDDLLLEKLGSTSAEILHLLEENNYNIIDVERNTSIIEFPFSGNIIAYPNKE